MGISQHSIKNKKMKVTLIANVSANGKVLFTDNRNYHEPREALLFFIQYANWIEQNPHMQ